MRYEFTLDEIKVPFGLPNLKTLSLDVVADVKVAVSVSDDGEAVDPEIQFDGKWQAVTGWLADVILETADKPYHQDEINDLLNGLADEIADRKQQAWRDRELCAD